METIYYLILAFIALFIVGPVRLTAFILATHIPVLNLYACQLTLSLSLQALLQDRSPIPETSGNVHKLASAAELDALLRSTTHVVVDFYADWCPPCRAIAPVFSKLADDHARRDHLAFAKVNVDHVDGVARRYDVSAMPTFVFFEGGRPAPVAGADSVKASASVVLKDGGVERIRGADRNALLAVVGVLGAKARKAAGEEEVKA